MTDYVAILFGNISLFAIILLVTSVFVFVMKPKSYWALAFGVVFGLMVYYFADVYNGFYQIAVLPGINYILYGTPLTVYVFGSLMVVAGLSIMLFSALYNIIDSWDKPAITIFQ